MSPTTNDWQRIRTGIAAFLVAAALGTGAAFARQADSAAASSQVENPESGSNTISAAVTNASSSENEQLTGVHHDVLFSLGHDVELKAGDSAQAVVVIFGDAKVEGKVHDAAVTVFGNLNLTGEARDAVAVMGDLITGPHTKIHDSAVTVGGRQQITPGAQMGRQPTEVDFPNWLKGWVKHCAIFARPLAPQVGFVWFIAFVFFLIYAFIAILIPRPVQACVNELNTRPATTCLIGLLSLILIPLVFGILAATGLGLVVVPFLLAALFFGGLLGRVALFEWLGFRLVGHFADNLIIKPLLALIIGTVVIWILYIVPVIGLLTFAVISVWGFGAAVLAAFGGLRRELPEKPATPPPPAAGVSPYSPADPLAGGSGSAHTFDSGTGGVATAPAVAAPPVLPDILSYPRAGFWERMGAGFLDLVLIGICSHFIGPFAFLVAVAYFAGLWTWRGTTIGGIVLGLKVVRLDGQPVTFAVALVRSLAAAFSIVVLFLGFLWIAWDADKQGWHDKIAGTVVLKLPRGTPLVCL